MGLLTTAAIIAVVAIVIVGIVLIALSGVATSQKLTALKAEGLVVNDIKTQNPNADVSLISVSNSTHANSWRIVASVIYNGSKPCPTVLIDVFDYPALGLQPSTDNLYSSGCAINGLSDAPSYVISLPQIAIARSYSSNNTEITSYVNRFGYGNTFVTARFISQSDANASVLGNETNVWLVKYKATNANYSLSAVVGESGTILQTFNSSG